MEKREPRKGRGVPRETPADNSIADLQQALTEGMPNVDWRDLSLDLEARGFYQAGMQRQVGIMAEVALARAGRSPNGEVIIKALAASPVEKVRGVSAFVVPLLHANSLDAQFGTLRYTGRLEGTWPRELSATVLHNLILEHGVSRAMEAVGEWLADEDPAIRRLAIESFRPRGVMLAHLPELKRDPTPLRAHLEPLLDDTSDYVRRAVANNLNDVSKDNPDVVLDWAEEWLTGEPSSERRWVLSRALRTLTNAGDLRALALLGYAPASALRVTWADSTPSRVEINQLLRFDIQIENVSGENARGLLLLNMDAPGRKRLRRQSKYQIWRGSISAGATKQVTKQIHFVDRTTQTKEPGTYRLTLVLNGQELESREMTFER